MLILFPYTRLFKSVSIFLWVHLDVKFHGQFVKNNPDLPKSLYLIVMSKMI